MELPIACAIQDLGKLKMEKPVMLWMLPTQQQVQSSSSKIDIHPSHAPTPPTCKDPDR